MLSPVLLHWLAKKLSTSLHFCNSGCSLFCLWNWLLRLRGFGNYFTGLLLLETGECKCLECSWRNKCLFFKRFHSALNIKQHSSVSTFAFLLSKPNLIYAKHDRTSVCTGLKLEYIIFDGEMSHLKCGKWSRDLEFLLTP